jgi:peptidoglycan/xylan/chitin deacetylase (PgdA/CDA1 family)
MLPELFGTYGEGGTLRTILLRQVLLNLNISPRILNLLSPVAEKLGRGRAWFDVLYSYCYWRRVRQVVPSRDEWRRITTLGIPILMYHAFGMPGESAGRFVVPDRRFAWQMAWLKRMRYRVISLEEFLRYRREYRMPPARSVVITIDDGYADNYSVAYPILRRYGFPATIFLVSRYIGGANRWDRQGRLAGRALLGWSEIKEMQRGDVKFGAHTRTHPRLSRLSVEQAQDEIDGSRADLEHELGVPFDLFSYPHGDYAETSRLIVERAGFLGACTTHIGKNMLGTSDFELRRSEIRGTDSFVRFVLTLWLGDNHLPARDRKEGRGR